MLTGQHLKRAPKFRCHTADDHAEFRCLPIDQIAAKELRSHGFSISEGRFRRSRRGFPLPAEEFATAASATRLRTPPLANLAALTLAGRIHKLPANLQGRAP